MEQIKSYWVELFDGNREEDWLERKKELFQRRGAEILKISGRGDVHGMMRADQKHQGSYLLHLSYLVRQGEFFYVEEERLPMRFTIAADGTLERHEQEERDASEKAPVLQPSSFVSEENVRAPRAYNRLAAVQYAERWWNDFNPNFRRFADDCTNYISQCLLAGGGPMWGAPTRDRGWWYGDKSWSFSWSVAHSLRWYLAGSKQGIAGKEVAQPEDLMPGDVICYDFQGDGNYDHTTIVVAKDANGMPLVNAHTNNSRNRYWEYRDSAAWTPNIKYKFFSIHLV